MKDATHFIEVWSNKPDDFYPHPCVYISGPSSINLLAKLTQNTTDSNCQTIAIWKIKLKEPKETSTS